MSNRTKLILNERANWCGRFPHRDHKPGRPLPGAHGQTYKMMRSWAIATDNNNRGGFKTWSKWDHKS